MSSSSSESDIARPAPQLVNVPPFTVIGFSVRTTNALEMSGSQGRIGSLWAQFLQGGADSIPSPLDPATIYAVYTRYESDENGPYDLVLGKSVHAAEQAPANMEAIHVPAARYLVFQAGGRSPDAIRAAWMTIYTYFAAETASRRAFSADFEQYTSSATSIFIALR